MKQPPLSPREIVEIKLLGIEGVVGAGPVARLYRRSAETIRRIWRGESHHDVVVLGEEGIKGRKPLPERPGGEGASTSPAPVSEESAQESLDRLNKLLKGE